VVLKHGARLIQAKPKQADRDEPQRTLFSQEDMLAAGLGHPLPGAVGGTRFSTTNFRKPFDLGCRGLQNSSPRSVDRVATNRGWHGPELRNLGLELKPRPVFSAFEYGIPIHQ
jgi:hypothetical protein